MRPLAPAPGTEWVADAVRWVLAPPDRRTGVPAPPDDWRAVVQAVQRHRLVGTVAPHAAELGAPERVVAALRSAHRASAERALRVAADSAEITACLESHGVPALLLKGPALAAQQGRSMAERGAGDVDVWVDSSDIAAAEFAVRQLGYARATALLPELSAVDGWRHRLRGWLVQERLLVRDGHSAIDLHWRPVANPDAVTFDFAEAVARSVPAAGLGCARTLAPGDALVTVSAHANQDAWSTLRHVVDVVTLVRAMDTSEVVGTARHDPVVMLALTVAGRVAPDVGRLADPSARTQRLARRAWTVCLSDVSSAAPPGMRPPLRSRWIVGTWRVASAPSARAAVQPAAMLLVPRRAVLRPSRLRRSVAAVALDARCTLLLVIESARLAMTPTDQLMAPLGEPQPVQAQDVTPPDRAPSSVLSDVRTARQVGRAVGRAAERLPWHPTCLRQALAVRRALDRAGIPNVVLVGVADARTVDAHAWVTVHGEVVVGGQQREFAPVAAFARTDREHPTSTPALEGH